MDKWIKIGGVIACCLLTILVNAQEPGTETDFMRSNGKIYVVMAVVVTIVLGLFLYMLNLDRKISKIERNN